MDAHPATLDLAGMLDPHCKIGRGGIRGHFEF